jgi:hypothetical protein
MWPPQCIHRNHKEMNRARSEGYINDSDKTCHAVARRHVYPKWDEPFRLTFFFGSHNLSVEKKSPVLGPILVSIDLSILELGLCQ